MRRYKPKIDHPQILSMLSRYKDDFIVDGRIVGPSNFIYTVISSQLNKVMSPSAIYTYAKQNKEALTKYAESGVREVMSNQKENIVPKQRGRRRLKNVPKTNLMGSRNVGDVDESAGNDELRPDDEMKFMENFDPEKSKREQRKLNRKISNVTKRSTVYDDKGIHIKTGLDICDCMNDRCEGCFFACAKCRSFKCGQECRSTSSAPPATIFSGKKINNISKNNL
uniref:ARF7 effector protein C-terminal domain-containing protein n=1 Tax=Graphocephala atropunctata TaxID=36148 RepID=A0A1B6LXR4_9HEMI